MNDPNGIINARSVSVLAPYVMSAISDEGLRSLAFSPSPCYQKYTVRSNVLVLDRIVSGQ